MGMTPEGRVKKKIKEYLVTTGAWYYMPVSNGMGRVGCPDILVCYKGHFLAFEVKSPAISLSWFAVVLFLLPGDLTSKAKK